ILGPPSIDIPGLSIILNEESFVSTFLHLGKDL
ncbi:unnamed protein product, partial [marine sediment metagenome]